MSAFSHYLQNALVDHIFRDRPYTVPGGLYIGLFTAAPNAGGGGTEVSGGAYERVQVGPSYSAWESTQGTTSDVASSGTDGTTQNGGTITFPTPTADWGRVSHFGIFDDDDNLLLYGALAAPKNINLGDPAPNFPAGSLDVGIDAAV